MFWYLVVFAILLALAFFEGGKRQSTIGIIAAVTLIVFGGLRYETGFDWAAYESYLYFSPALGQAYVYVNIDTFTAEPAYALLNVAFRTLGLGFQSLIFLIALFNIIILYRFINKFTPAVVSILLWYYGTLFLTGQMATIRQALSVSFIYLAILSIHDGRGRKAFVYSIISVAFHTFSIVFAPILYIRRNSLKPVTITVLALAGYLVVLSGTDLFRLFATYILIYIDGGIITSKLSLYAGFEGARISWFALLLLVWHLAFIWLIERRISEQEISRDYFVNFSLWMTTASIVAHAYFATFPIVWNRLMLVTFVVQAIVYSRIFLAGRMPVRPFGLYVAITATLSFILLSFTLLGPQSMVFKPYQSMMVVWVRGPYGDGRLRYEIIRKENDLIAAETKI